jgi:hypothetical protein
MFGICQVLMERRHFPFPPPQCKPKNPQTGYFGFCIAEFASKTAIKHQKYPPKKVNAFAPIFSF